MALACNKTPDHSTIAAFVSSIDEEIEDLFTMVLMICHEEGLLGGTHFSIDGLKLSSNASKEWSGKFDDLKKKQDALRRKVKQIVKEHKRSPQLLPAFLYHFADRPVFRRLSSARQCP